VKRSTNRYADAETLDELNRKAIGRGDDAFGNQILDQIDWEDALHECIDAIEDRVAAKVYTLWIIWLKDGAHTFAILDMEECDYRELPEWADGEREALLDFAAEHEEWRDEDGEVDRDRLRNLIDRAKQRRRGEAG
jgi:hypothetical protein